MTTPTQSCDESAKHFNSPSIKSDAICVSQKTPLKFFNVKMSHDSRLALREVSKRGSAAG